MTDTTQVLDEKAREAAHLWAIEAASDGGVPGTAYIDGILTAYLTALSSKPYDEGVEDHLPRCDCGHLFEVCDAPKCSAW